MIVYVPFPSANSPRPGDCFYCRWYTRCPFHAGEPLDLIGYTDRTLRLSEKAKTSR